MSTTLSVHRHTPTVTALDSRGLGVRAVSYWRDEDSRLAQARINHTTRDPFGRVVAQWDPRLWGTAQANLATVYSLSAKVLGTDSVDAGWRLGLWGEGEQQLEQWDGRGTRRQIRYDEQWRPVAVFENGECTEQLAYGDKSLSERNQCGRLVRHDDPAGVLLFSNYGLTGSIDEQERRFTAESPSGAITYSRFNPLAERLFRVDAQGNQQRWRQTLDGRLRAVDLRLSNATEWLPMVSAITYSAHGQVEKEVAGNGVVTVLEYTAEDGRLKRLLSRAGQEGPLQDLRYAYDPTGNVLSIEDAALPIRYFANQRIEPINRYAYDSLSQLIEATGWEAGTVKQGPLSEYSESLANYRQTYRYDDGNNLLGLIHIGAQNPGHRLVAAAHSNRCLPVRGGVEPDEGDFRSGFDANGNLLNLQPGQALSWDLRNQLREVRPVEREAGPDDNERYIYDAEGMRVRKIRSLQTSARTNTLEARYLPGLEIRTHSGTGEELHVIDIQTGRGSVRVLHWESGRPTQIANHQQRYSLTDHLGSSTLELDQDANIITQERYYPFGGTAWSSGEAVQVSYKTVRYSGKERDATGLYYYGYRYYLPQWQRWLNPDPAGEVDGLNVYAMVRNGPLINRDRWGLNGDSETESPAPRRRIAHQPKSEAASEVQRKVAFKRSFSSATLGVGEAGLSSPSKQVFRSSVSQGALSDRMEQPAPSTFGGQKRPRLVETFPGEKSPLSPGETGKNVFFHYTGKNAHAAILATQALKPSEKNVLGNRLPQGMARHYFTNLNPSYQPLQRTSELIFGRRYYGNALDKMSHYFEINTSGLNVIKSRDNEHVFYVETPFDIPLQYRTGENSERVSRVLRHGETQRYADAAPARTAWHGPQVRATQRAVI
ncbi:RHS repeat domain-containing protein [Pseudomonas sp. B21-053]|uniref:RHS repeat domain-containing protein n=1 Tax=Pseudomonas sp. B21-053 TaxID=2895493 RepID=UPI00222FE8F0|nr:RHS repeat-associated core domain-containing protein [Pseudomonas sp. B21-053]UZE13004.1 toxin [Pseudomonas sp. B21-053]